MSTAILPCDSNVSGTTEITGISVKEGDRSYQNCKDGKWVTVLRSTVESRPRLKES